MSRTNELDDQSEDDEVQSENQDDEPSEDSAGDLTLEYDEDVVVEIEDEVADEEVEDEEYEQEYEDEDDEVEDPSTVRSETGVTDIPDTSSDDATVDQVAEPASPTLQNLSVSVSESRVVYDRSAAGLRRADDNGFEVVDTLAGRSSCFGFGYAPIVVAVQSAAEDFLGDSVTGSTRHCDHPASKELLAKFSQVFAGAPDTAPQDFETVLVASSADEAIERTIAGARSIGESSKYRTVTLIGSDHGRTALCRTASGRPELHEDFGPMVAGFSHVPSDNVKALKATVDERTAAVMISPVSFADGVQLIDKAFLVAARDLCDQYGCALIIDESRLAFATSGSPLTFTEISPVRSDAVILSAGLLGGMPGGFVLASGPLALALSSADSDSHRATCINGSNFPLAVAAASATLTDLVNFDFDAAKIDMQGFAVDLAECIGGFEFVRDLSLIGMTIGIETDLDAQEVVLSAARRGLRLETAGATTVRLQLPVAIAPDELETVLTKIGDTFEAIERVTSASSV